MTITCTVLELREYENQLIVWVTAKIKAERTAEVEFNPAESTMSIAAYVKMKMVEFHTERPRPRLIPLV